MSISKLRSFFYAAGKYLGDYQAVKSGNPKRIGKRIYNRIYGKIAGKGFRR